FRHPSRDSQEARGLATRYRAPLEKCPRTPARDMLAYRDGEVTVRTAAPAEGDVDVEVAHGGKVSTPLTPTQTPSPAAASRRRASRAPSGPSARRSYPCQRWRPARRHAWV